MFHVAKLSLLCGHLQKSGDAGSKEEGENEEGLEGELDEVLEESLHCVPLDSSSGVGAKLWGKGSLCPKHG